MMISVGGRIEGGKPVFPGEEGMKNVYNTPNIKRH
jgi:hypothetical protein